MSYPCAISIAGLSRPTAHLIVHSIFISYYAYCVLPIVLGYLVNRWSMLLL